MAKTGGLRKEEETWTETDAFYKVQHANEYGGIAPETAR